MKPTQTLSKIFTITLIGVFSILITFLINEDSFLCKNFFIFNYLGLLLGFLITLTVVALNSIEKILTLLSTIDKLSQKKITKFIENISSISIELKEDTYLVFFCFIFVLMLNLWSSINIPIIKLSYKIEIILILKIMTFLLSFFSIYDILKTMFSLYDITIELYKLKTIQDKSNGNKV